MRSRSLGARIALAVVAVGGPAAVALAFAAPLTTGPVLCGFRRMFGIPCPGCGLTRSLVSLVHLDLRAAFTVHPVGPIFLGYLALLWTSAWISYARTGDLASPISRRIPGWAHLGMIGLVILVWILRFFGLFGGPVAPVDPGASIFFRLVG
ncbi:MAG: DUF2752 domain-containing protein [Deltaproteobacteria bacterium]|nr:DUF2752 domain-containing protein [Deltaproteobacteria bacterium]